jgi:DamX protein
MSTGYGAVAPYFMASSLRQRLDLMHHLIGFGRQIIVVRGAPGSGRSSLLANIAAEANPQWLIVQLSGQRIDTGTGLLNLLLDALEGESGHRPTDAEDLEARVCRQLGQLHGEHRYVVLIADDCDEWSDVINALMFRLAHTQNAVGELRVVVSCEQSSDFFERLQVVTRQASLLHLIEIPKLDHTDTTALLQLVAEHADYAPLEPPAISAIADAGNGNPARLLALLAAAQLEHGTSLPLLRRAPKWQRIGGVILVVLVALGLAALTVSNRESEPPDQHGMVLELPLSETQTSGESMAPLPNGASSARRSDLPAGAEVVAPSSALPELAPAERAVVLAETPSITALATPFMAVTATPVGQPTAPLSVNPVVALAPPNHAEDIAEAAPAEAVVDTSEPVLAEPHEPPPVVVLPQPRSAVPGYTAQWVLAQPVESYVIQLFGGRERAAAKRFIIDHDLAETATSLQVTHEAAPWHIVILGHYRDLAGARLAISQLGSSLRRTGPWPRSVASLKK